MSSSSGGSGDRSERVGPILDGLLDRLGIRREVQDQGLLQEWEGLVGEEIARVARPTALSKGVLFVEVDSSAWLNELNLLRPQLLERINEGQEAPPVRKVVFRLRERR